MTWRTGTASVLPDTIRAMTSTSTAAADPVPPRDEAREAWRRGVAGVLAKARKVRLAMPLPVSAPFH